MWKPMHFRGMERAISSVLSLSMLVNIFAPIVIYIALLTPIELHAAEVAIDTTVSTAANSANGVGSRTVFIDDDTGYVFYRDRSGRCVYSKTADAGATWGTAVIVDDQTDCIKVTVWYDRWTPGDDSGTNIHIGSMDTSNDDLFYNRLDTSSDTLLSVTGTNASVNSGQVAVLANGAHTMSITKATDGEIYMVTDDNLDAFIVSCSSSCDSATSWGEVGTSPLDASNDHNILLPLSGGDVMLINRDISANDMRSATWNGAGWSGWSNIDNNALENTTYDGGFAAAVNKNTGDIYLAYVADHNNFAADDHDIRTAVYDGSGWTTQTDVLTDVPGRGLHDVTLAIDENTDDVYIAYAIEDTINTNTTGNVYYKISTTSMTSWAAEQGPVSATAGNIYWPSLNLFDNERMYVSWYNHTDGTLYGETVANIGPDTLVTSVGSAVSEARAGEVDVYLGGKFAIESISSRSVSAITLTETGTIHGQDDLSDLKLYYELDTSAPYDCVSETYSGGEAQFGSTDAGGFSGSDGTASFSGTIVGISPLQTMCVYLVASIEASALDGATIAIEVTDPTTDISVSGTAAYPTVPVGITGSTTIVSPSLTQTHFHWRNDNGSETGATSATGGVEDISLDSLSKNLPRRLRIGISNEGSTSTLSSNFALEYAAAAPTCDVATGWTNVGEVGGAWDMFDSANITEGGDTTDIAVSSGGVTDENNDFLTPNGGLRDTTATATDLILATTEYADLEFSIVAVPAAVEGETYCFRVTDAGEEFAIYSEYPSATIAADVTVSAFGTQITQTDIPSTDVHLGGGFSFVENGGGRDITEIILSESGTVDAQTGLSDVKLFFELDTSVPYDCASESYSGTESQFGTASTFSSADGISTLSGSISITATATACVYPVVTVTESGQNGQTIEVSINSPSSDVTASLAGSVAPSTPVEITASTTLRGAVLTQVHYHWRNDNGPETTATSYTGGLEDIPVSDFPLDSAIRLRLGISNEGATTSVPTQYQLEYGAKITTCDAVSVWTDVESAADDDWDMFDSTNLVNGSDTTDVAEVLGGVSDENTSFLGTNGGVRDTESVTGTTTLSESQYVDLEFSITTTINTTYETTYCFRVNGNGESLLGYDEYAEITTLPKRDFRIQRGTTTITGTDITLLAGTDYTAPSSTSTAFIRIANTNNTGAGRVVGGGSQRVNDVTAYVSDQSDITSSITFSRADVTDDTFIDWEIIEFVGLPGTDNEIIVRQADTASFTSGETAISAPAVTGILDDSDVVVFVTGSQNRNTARNFYAGQVTSNWATTTSQPTFDRGATGGAAVDVSYAVVEFVGLNWNIQRIEHAYTASGVTETATTSPVSSLERTFLHTQKRMGGGSTNVVHFGHTVIFSSLGAISFQLESGSNVANQVSVAWVIENTQSGLGAMKVQRVSGSTTNGSEPLLLSLPIPVSITAMNNTSIFGNSRAGGTNNAFPRPIAGLSITSVDTFQIWRSDSGQVLTYETEIIEWPAADVAIRQNYYRLYADNNALTPSDPWPAGATDLGENTPVTATNDALGEGEVIRLRMSARVSNANISAGFQAFKLQYGQQLTTCSAVDDWADVGDTASSSVWRGYTATGTTDGTAVSADPPVLGELLLSVSDIGGRLEHENPATENPYNITDGEDVEYDWYLEQNGATPSTPYCFRMIRGDNTTLDGYFNYPAIRTAGFSPAGMDWQWYSDSENETPSADLATVNVAPSSIGNEDIIALRITIDETKNVIGSGAKFRLQYSEYPDFSIVSDVVATTTCAVTSTWCYSEAPVADNTLITTSVLGDGDGCVAGTGNGCGTHNSQPAYTLGHTHGAGRALEYSFTLQSAAPRVNATYYFRLVDTSTGLPVATADGETNPSLVTENSTLNFTLTGLPSGTTTAGVTTDISTTPNSIDFGPLTIGSESIGAQRIEIVTNATEGFQIFKYARSQMVDSYGNEITALSAPNAAPGSWTALCDPLVASCVGYHSTDATLSGDITRFAALDTYAGLHTDLEEIMYSSVPATTTEDIVYRIVATELQPAGEYETDIVYVAVPVY